MVGTRRRLTEPPVGGEELSVKKEEEAMIVLDDEEGGQRCSLTREIGKLRERWELASVLNFLNVFEPVIGVNMKISAEEIETGLINPNSSLAQLHITLLKGIPPVSKTLNVSDVWVTVLCKKLAPWWPWVAEGDVPLRAAKGEEMSRYKGLNPTERLLMLKALCEIRADQEDTVAYISDALKQGTPVSSFRKDKIGGDGNGISYWYDGNKVIGYRLYREATIRDSKTMSKGKRYLDQSTNSSQWTTLATNLEEFHKVADVLSSSKVGTEAAVGRIVKNDAIAVLEKVQKDKDRAMKKKQRQEERLLNDFRTFNPVGVIRSCRNRRPVNYTFDDYDRSIDEAIKLSRNSKTTEEQNQEMEHNESRSNDGAPERNTNSEDSDKEKETPLDAYADDACKRDDSMDSDTNYVQEFDSDDENNDSGEEKDDASNNLSDLDNEVDRTNRVTGCVARNPHGQRWSIRLAAGNSQPVVENGSLRTKNRLRQRPTHNSAIDSVVIPDSDSEKSSEDANQRESENEILSPVTDPGDVGDI